MRINRALARSGVASRRGADELIASGRVLVNGAVPSVGAQPVYKCKSPQGKVAYSHEPCVGAQVVDTTPTQGLDRSMGFGRVLSDDDGNSFRHVAPPC